MLQEGHVIHPKRLSFTLYRDSLASYYNHVRQQHRRLNNFISDQTRSGPNRSVAPHNRAALPRIQGSYILTLRSATCPQRRSQVWNPRLAAARQVKVPYSLIRPFLSTDLGKEFFVC
jgi:hypothetical protein